jgi:hypothetical protein
VKPLSIGVAVAAAFALVTGITKGAGDILGLAADPTLLSIGAVGLMLAHTTLRSSLISPFLRVFSTIFAVEYVVTALAYVAVRAGWWPLGLSELAPPASLATTIAIFGLLVHLISFIPVIRQITRLADPYFVTEDRGDIEGIAQPIAAFRQSADAKLTVPPLSAEHIEVYQGQKFSCNPICTCNGPQSAFRMPPPGGTAWRARPQFVKRPRLDGAGRAGRSQ